MYRRYSTKAIGLLKVVRDALKISRKQRGKYQANLNATIHFLRKLPLTRKQFEKAKKMELHRLRIIQIEREFFEQERRPKVRAGLLKNLIKTFEVEAEKVRERNQLVLEGATINSMSRVKMLLSNELQRLQKVGNHEAVDFLPSMNLEQLEGVFVIVETIHAEEFRQLIGRENYREYANHINEAAKLIEREMETPKRQRLPQ